MHIGSIRRTTSAQRDVRVEVTIPITVGKVNHRQYGSRKKYEIILKLVV